MRGRWSLRRVDRLTIGIPGEILQQFRRARRITTALFPDGAQNPTVRFSLTPVGLDDRANRFTLTMDGQTASYRHGPVLPTAMVWPGPQQPGKVSLVFTNRSGREVRQSFDGDWAWFRLLTPERIRRTSREDRLLVTFKLSGMTAVYQITTASLTNPFDATSALFRFRAPKRL
jgi:type VI secretion system protein ImpL